MQQQFAINKATGMKNREAAIAAGYSATSADVQAAQLMRREDIKAAIKAERKRLRANPDEPPADWDGDGAGESAKGTPKMPRKAYADAKEFLLDAMNHEALPIAARAEYAKALLPYQHGKVGDVGKKQNAKDRAAAVAKGEGGNKRPKFGTKEPPPLRAIQGGIK